MTVLHNSIFLISNLFQSVIDNHKTVSVIHWQYCFKLVSCCCSLYDSYFDAHAHPILRRIFYWKIVHDVISHFDRWDNDWRRKKGRFTKSIYCLNLVVVKKWENWQFSHLLNNSNGKWKMRKIKLVKKIGILPRKWHEKLEINHNWSDIKCQVQKRIYSTISV